MAIKAGNLQVFSEELNRAVDLFNNVANVARKQSTNIANNQGLTGSAIAEIEAAGVAALPPLGASDMQVKVVTELVKTATPLVYRNDGRKDIAVDHVDFGKFMKVSDDTLAFDPALL